MDFPLKYLNIVRPLISMTNWMGRGKILLGGGIGASGILCIGQNLYILYESVKSINQRNTIIFEMKKEVKHIFMIVLCACFKTAI